MSLDKSNQPQAAQVPNVVTAMNQPNMATIEEDCENIYKAIKGLGTDDDTLIRILCHRDYKTRMAISALYYTKYKRNLAKHIADDTSFNFKKLLVGLSTPRVEYLAEELQNAVKGLGTQEGAILDCIAFTSNTDLAAVQEEYQRKYKHTLEEAISDDTSGYFKQLCMKILQSKRDESTVVDTAKATSLADELYQAGEGRWGTDSKHFLELFTTTSKAQLEEVDKVYGEKYGNTLLNVIKKSSMGDFKRGLQAMMLSKNEWWVKRFHKSVRLLGTDNATLVRGLVLCSREELACINRLYHDEYEITLREAVKRDTSGYYRKAALVLLEN